MPDILHWLGIKKIDRMLSMSNMKHDAIVNTGIEIIERIPIPDEMIPSDSRVEIDAKIQSGYFTTGKQLTGEELAQVKGRGWEKWEDIVVSRHSLYIELADMIAALNLVAISWLQFLHATISPAFPVSSFFVHNTGTLKS
jgi:hypothetical protein